MPENPVVRQSNQADQYLGYTDIMENCLEQQSSGSLMTAYARGSSDAFTELYNRHKAPLFRFLLRQGISTSRTDELFQEIWLKVIKSRDHYQSTARFQTWLYTIARNHLIDDYRKNAVDMSQEYVEEHSEDQTIHKAEDSLDVDRKRSNILALVKALPFEQRQAFLLKHQAGFNNIDIAQITGTNQQTAKSRVRYAINLLKKQLGGSA